MYRLIEKLRLDRYVSSRLILALDLLVSAGASIISLLVASILSGPETLTWKTIGWWLGGSVVFSRSCCSKPTNQSSVTPPCGVWAV